MLRTEDVRAGLLMVDACILEHNTEHILFSLRVPKDALRRNHRLLAAISDHLGEGRQQSALSGVLNPGARPAMPRKRWRALLSLPAAVVASWALTLGLLVPTVNMVMASNKNPIELIDINVRQPQIKLGDMLHLTTTSRRLQVCMTTVDRLVLNKRTQQLVAYERLPAMWQATSSDPVTRSYQVPLPHGVVPGQYLYRAWVHSDCPDGESYHQQWRDVEFEVVH